MGACVAKVSIQLDVACQPPAKAASWLTRAYAFPYLSCRLYLLCKLVAGTVQSGMVTGFDPAHWMIDSRNWYISLRDVQNEVQADDLHCIVASDYVILYRGCSCLQGEHIVL